jgi:hypothetical protein
MISVIENRGLATRAAEREVADARRGGDPESRGQIGELGRKECRSRKGGEEDSPAVTNACIAVKSIADVSYPMKGRGLGESFFYELYNQISTCINNYGARTSGIRKNVRRGGKRRREEGD